MDVAEQGRDAVGERTAYLSALSPNGTPCADCVVLYLICRFLIAFTPCAHSSLVWVTYKLSVLLHPLFLKGDSSEAMVHVAMDLFKCLIQPLVSVFRHSKDAVIEPVQENHFGSEPQSHGDTNYDSTSNLLPRAPRHAPFTPQISIRTATETVSSIDGVDRRATPSHTPTPTSTPSGLSPVPSPWRNSDPWQNRSNGRHSPYSSGSRASSKNSLEQDSLGDQIRRARFENPQRRRHFFLPNCALESLITAENIEKDIQARDSNDGINDNEVRNVAEQASQVAKKLYAILAYMKLGPKIFSLLRDGVSDNDLPLRRIQNDDGQMILQRESGAAIRTFQDWSEYDIEEFDRIQWWMLAPLFEDKEHVDLEDDIILPSIPFKTNSETAKKKEGGYSEVYAVRLHPAHHNFWESSKSDEDEPLIAIKKLYSSEEKEFLKEVTILKALGSKHKKHPHLITLLATYRQEGKYHLMFPYANANLRTYWADRPSPSFNEATVLWSLEQMAGMSSALSLIHNFTVTYPLSIDGPGNVRFHKDAKLSVEKSEQLYGRHGDIKPENILWFQESPDTDDEAGILQIADFGLGRFHGRESRSNVHPDGVMGSPTYEPPECKLHRPVSRAYDIWSLGCLYLEFITWLLKGFPEIEIFSEFRGRSSGKSSEFSDDYFFTLTKVSPVETHAVVRDEVAIWVNQLHEHEKCSALMHDLLNLIMQEVIRIDPSRRIPAKRLSDKLNSCLSRAKEDNAYLLKPVPRQLKLNSDERSNSTSKVLEAQQTSGKKVTFTRPEKPVPLTEAHRKPPKVSTIRGPAISGRLSRSKTHGTWPQCGQGNG